MVKPLNMYASYQSVTEYVPIGPLNVNFELQNKMKRSDNIDSGLW